MSYVQIEIGGKLRGLKFNQFAMQELSLNYGRHDKLFGQFPDLFFVYNIFHAGLSGNCIAKEIEVDFTFYDVIDWVDDLYEAGKDEARQKVINTFQSTRLWQETVKTVTEQVTNKPEKKSLSHPKKKRNNANKQKFTGVSVQPSQVGG